MSHVQDILWRATMFYFIFFIILIIFVILDILTGFYLSKFLKKFLKTIPIFIADLVKRDREVFPGYRFLVL